ncbi:MAG: acyltransferase [Spirochaetia bacterium]|nr:MAG: acyltransferase [Spirochaetia bacterium]
MNGASNPPSAVPIPRRRGELIGIQYLRGLAAMMTVAFHLKSQYLRMGYTGEWPNGLSSGVDIFFVISGFIMLVTTATKPITPLMFWWRRIVRIVPLYWLVTGFMTAVLLIAPRLLQTATYDGWHMFASYMFLPAMHPAQNKLEPLVTPGWTLNYEMFFYLIFGLFLLAPRRLRFAGTVGTIFVLVVAGSVFSPSDKTILGFYTSSIMFEFALGMALGEIALRSDLFTRAPRSLGWVLLIGGLVLLVLQLSWFGMSPRVLSGPLATSVVAGALIIETHNHIRNVPLLYALGNASFSIYLTQIVVTSALMQAWRHLGLHNWQGGLTMFAIVDIVACAVVGWLCYRFIERSLTRFFRPGGLDGARMRLSGATAQLKKNKQFIR